MSGNIKEVVDVVITKEGVNLQQEDFSTMLMLLATNAQKSNIAEYAETSELLTAANFTIESIGYKAATVAFAPKIKPEKIKIAKKGFTTRNSAFLILASTVISTANLTITVEGESVEVDNGDLDAAGITAALETLLTVGSGNVLVTELIANRAWIVEFKSDLAGVYVNTPTVELTGTVAPGTTVDAQIGFYIVNATAISGSNKLAITVAVNGEEQTTADIESLAGTKAALEALSNVVTVTVTEIIATKTLFVQFDGNIADACISVTAKEGAVDSTVTDATRQETADATWAAALARVLQADHKWFAFTAPNLNLATDRTVQTELATIIQANEYKAAGFVTTDSHCKTAAYSASTPGDIADDLKALSLTSSFVVYTSHEDEFPVESILGLQLPKRPGSSTFKFKTCSGVTAEDLTTSNKTNLLSKACNYNEVIGGKKIFTPGRTSEDENIETLINTMFLQSRIAEYVFNVLANAEIMYMDAPGVIAIGTLVFTAIVNYGQNYNITVPETIVVTTPDYASISAVDKQNGVVDPVEFEAKLRNAVHKIKVRGKLYL